MTNKKPKIAELHMTPSLSGHSTSSTNSSPTSGVTLEPAAPDQAPAVTYSIIYSPALGSESSGGTEMDVEENDNGGKKKNASSHPPPTVINSNTNSNTVDLTDETDSAMTTIPHKTTFTMPNGTAFFVPMSTNLTTNPAAAMLQFPANMATPLRGSCSPTGNNSIYTDIFGVNKLFVSQTNIQPEVVSGLLTRQASVECMYVDMLWGCLMVEWERLVWLNYINILSLIYILLCVND